MTIADDDVRHLVATSGLGRTLFVEAGAGTGKTTQLVDRVTSLVLGEGIRLDQIAAITFTEAAASELQDRIRVAFEKRAAVTDDETEKARSQQAIADADLAAISTLHGFAKRILGEHALAVGLPPKVGILDEVSSALARERRWERFVDGLYADAGNEQLLVRAALTGIALEARYPGHTTMKDVAYELASNWDRLERIAAAEVTPLPALDFEAFDEAARDVEALADGCPDRQDLFYCHLLANVLPRVRAIAGIADPDRRLRALATAEDWKVGRGGKPAAWGSDVKAAKEKVTALNTARDEVIRSAAEDVLSRLLILVSREVLAAAEERRAEGQLEFHDLLVLCRRLLRTDLAARASLHRRYTRLLLDEFQDTDPIQLELAVLIAASIEDGEVADAAAGGVGGEAADWAAMDIEQGRLFFVGDPKQSIYRFRRADIDQFLRARDVFGRDDGWVKLTTNFRTVPQVLAWINEAFDEVMADEIPGMQPRYERLMPHRPPSPGGDHRPVLIGHAHDKVKAGELRQLEAEDVVGAIDAIRSSPDGWPVWDRDNGGWRDARLTDITILVPTRTSLPYLRSALAARAIPYRINTGSLVYDTQEVRDILATLQAVDDPTDTLSLVTALRSPLYACSDVDLFTFRTAGGRWDLRSAPPQDLDPSHPVVAAVSHLRSLWTERWWTTPSALLDRVLQERQAFLLAFGEPRPKEVWGRLRFLLDQARAFEEAEGGDLRRFLEWAGLQRSESARVHEPLLPELDDDAVRVMTIHGAKGLEFPITIVSGMTTKPSTRRTGVSLVWEDGMPEVRLRTNVTTANHDPRADIEMEMDKYEKLRLLYVACTRARDHLIVACHHKAGDGSYACIVSGLEKASLAARSLPAPDGSAVTAQPRLPFAPPDDDRAAWVEARERLLSPQRASWVTSATAIATAAAARAEAGLAGAGLAGAGLADAASAGGEEAASAGGDGSEGGSPVIVRRRGRAGTAIGRAVHATLQVLDLNNPKDVDGQAARQAYLEGVSESSQTVAAMVRSALGSPAIRTAAAGVHHKELYVCAPLEGRVIEGYIDLLAETAEGLVIVDYKTDTVASEAAVDEKLTLYEVQGAAYALALEAATGLTVRECRFVFCRPAGAIERRVNDLEAAEERVRQELRSQHAGP